MRADIALVTSDNPRTEKPESIIEMILEGVRRTGKPERSAADLVQGQSGFHVEPDRGAAISRAVALARVGDVVLLAGKGHEDYQIVGTEKTHFDDREIAAAEYIGFGSGGSLPPSNKLVSGLIRKALICGVQMMLKIMPTAAMEPVITNA